MADTGIIRLDPRAQEFRPRSSTFVSVPPPTNPNPALPFFHPFLPPLPQHPLFDAFAAASSAPPFLAPLPLPPPPPLPPPFSDSFGNFQQPAPPPPPQPHALSRAVVLSPLPSDVSETTVRMELEVFGEVRAVEMEWVGDGIVAVHFYDLRHAKRAVREIREQYNRAVAPREDGYSHPFMRGRFGSGKKLFGGRPVWAQFVIPVASCIPEGQNQGTIVIFNLDPAVSADELRRTFEAFGPVKELRDTPYKKHQRFVEFYDVRDASRALREMNGKELNGRSIVIEFSRPGGFSRKLLNATTPSSSTFPNPNLNFGTTGSFVPRAPNSPPQPHLESLPSRPSHPPRKVSQGNGGFLKDGLFIEGSMSNLSLDVGGTGDASGGGMLEDDFAYTRKTGKKKLVGSKQQQQLQPQLQMQQLKGKNWKGKRQLGKVDCRFVITEDSMEAPRSSGDSRTTIMIKNIPNKYSQKLLLSMLDNHCIHTNEQVDGDGGDIGGSQQPFSSYDFVYLPIDFNNKCNVGYGFVNMTTPEAARRLYKAFHRRHWEVFNSRKICEVTYARIQGLEALREHFKNSKFPSEMDHYLPVVFAPPRDGRTLTEPSPVVARTQLLLNKDDHCEGTDGGDPGEDESSDGEDRLGLAIGGSSCHSLSRQSSDGGAVEGGNNDGVSEGVMGLEGGKADVLCRRLYPCRLGL